MEGCMEATARALKPSLRKELDTQQGFLDDVWCATGISGVLPCEDFSVDDLLDFSNGDFEEEEEEEEEEVGSIEEEDEKDSLSVSSSSQEYPSVYVDDNNSNSSSTFDACYHESFLTSEIFLEPVDEIKELEWVSQVMDDSSRSEFSLLYPNYAGNRAEPVLKPVKIEPTCFPFRVPSKTRTKRTRPATGWGWSHGCPVLNDSPASSSASSGLTSTSGLVVTNTVHNQEWLSGSDEPAAKKLKKKSPVQTGSLFQRRCSHCQTQKTPQWRTGPNGPKTLCNACGVRYKSGRLFPEYRPACSPTFSRDVHSNSHRKVLEMRKKKELAGPEVGVTHMVQSF